MVRPRKQNNSSWTRLVRKRQQKGRRPRRPRSKPSPLKNVLRSVYQVISALPILPAPVKAVSDWVARQFGLTSATRDKARKYNLTDGVLNSLEWAGFVRTSMLVTGTPNGGAYREDQEVFWTNIRSVRLINISFNLQPQNPVSSRAGYYTLAFFPSTSAESYSIYSEMSADQLGYERLLVRAPVKARWPAATGGNISYTVPKSNVYLHNGIPLQPHTTDARDDIVGLLVVVYNREDRTEYSDFTPDQVAFDLRVKGTALPMQIDPLTPIQLYGSQSIRDFNEGQTVYVFRNPKTKETFTLNKPKWNTSTKAFEASSAVEELTLAEMEL